MLHETNSVNILIEISENKRMELQVKVKDFANLLAIGGCFAGKNKVIPLLNDVKVEARGGKCYTTSFDGESSAIKRLLGVKTNNEDGFSFCVDAINLGKTLNVLNKDEVVTLKKNETTITIIHEAGSMELPFDNVDDYPVINKDSNLKNFVVESNILLDWLKESSSFIIEDTLKPQMSGLYVSISNNRMCCCGTDASVLYANEATLGCQENIGDISFVIPKKVFVPLLNLLKETENNNVFISADDKNIWFANANSRISFRIVEGKYPNYNAVIPTNHTITVEIVKEQLVSALNRANIFTDLTKCVKMHIENDKLHIIATNIDLSKKSQETLPISHVGEDLEIGVNGERFINNINSIDSEVVQLFFTSSSRPILMKDELNKNKQIIAMPMMLK